MTLNSSDLQAIARKQVKESFYGYSQPKIDPLLEADLRHGWMFAQVVKWDRLIYGRWDYWMEKAYQHIKHNQFSDWVEIKTDIPKIDFLEPEFTYPGSQMLKYCFDSIQHPRLRDRKFDIAHFRYLVDWILFGLGDKNCTRIPVEPIGCDGASSRLFQTFSVPHFMVYPCDYLGKYLEAKNYIPAGKLKTQDFIREYKIGEILKPEESSEYDYIENPLDDPEILTGRVLLELSNYVNILVGFSRDELLGKCALINGYFFAPWICKHLSEDLASIYNPDTHEEISTWITETEFRRLTRITSKNADLVSFITDDDLYQMIMMGGYCHHG